MPLPQPSNALVTITDEEMKTGDPTETLRRASMQPAQIAAGAATHRSSLAPTAWPGGITTRQQRKRLSDESHQGPDTPEVSPAHREHPAVALRSRVGRQRDKVGSGG